MNTKMEQPKHLAWHETLEMHELVGFQAANLVAFKKKLPSLSDPGLAALYKETIAAVETNLKELLAFYPQAPVAEHRKDMPELLGPESAQLLGFTKTAVRSYAIAITESATPQLKATFQKHLLGAIALHTKVFEFAYERGLYPAYNLTELLASDVKKAQMAISL